MIALPKGLDLLSPSALFASGLAGTDRLVILGNEQPISGRALLEKARQMERELKSLGPSTVAVHAARAENIIAAMVACIQAGADLVLLPEAWPLDHPLLHEAGVSALFDENLGLTVRADGHRPGNPALILPTRDSTRLVLHDRDAFLARVPSLKGPGCWLLTEAPGSFTGLQVLLSAFKSSGILLAYPAMSVPQLAQRAIAHQVSHIGGTPIFFRSLLRALKEQTGKAAFKHISIFEEIAPEALLEEFRTLFPKARVTQIYGSLEGGVLFSVQDGLPGFPAEWLEQGVDNCQLRIAEGRLEVISPGAMRGYAGKPGPMPCSPGGWFKPGYAAVREGNRVLLSNV
jgi:acyl-CoA synthetase (AMP-forming)/AMP-acid ligase II